MQPDSVADGGVVAEASPKSEAEGRGSVTSAWELTSDNKQAQGMKRPF
jgi:hypothetical protein